MSDWDSLPLGKCGTWFSGGTPSRDNPEYWGGHIPWISGKSLHNYYIHDAEEYVTSEGSENGTRLVPPGTILLLVRGMMLHKKLPVGITTREVAFNQDVKAIVPNKKIHPEYLLYWFITYSGQILDYVEESSHGTGRLPTDLLQRTEIKFPPLEEQRKIAQILSTWDEAIALVEALIAALQERKRGLMQRLLTGEVRFPGFDRTLENHQLGELVEFITRTEKVMKGKTYRLVGVRWYVAGVHIHEVRLGEDIITDSLSRVEENDIMYNKMWVSKAAFGIAKAEHNGAYGTSEYPQFVPMADMLDVDFMGYLFHNPRFQYDATVLCMGTTGRIRLHPEDFLKINVMIPEVIEQSNIADCLKAVDVEINEYVNYRDGLREQKKGLMQRLLTGAVRV